MAKIIYLEKPFVLRPYSKKELRSLMGLSKHVMNRWLKAIEPELGLPVAGLYTIKQVQHIVDVYGVPGQLINEAA